MNPPTNNSKKRRTEYRFYSEIVAAITTRNAERKDITGKQKTKKSSNTDPTKKNTGVNAGGREG